MGRVHFIGGSPTPTTLRLRLHSVARMLAGVKALYQWLLKGCSWPVEEL